MKPFLDETARGEGAFGSTAAKSATLGEVSNSTKLFIQPLCPEAEGFYKEHGQFHKGDSGLDLFCVKDEIIPGGETRFVKLGIAASAWEKGLNVSWLLMPRSSISKTPLRLCNSVGLVDAGYRGEVMAAFDNVTSSDFDVKRGDRLVQAVGFSGRPLSCMTVNDLDSTSRGEGGFGSTRALPTPQQTTSNKRQRLET